LLESAGWKAGQPVPYHALAKTFEAIEAISARLRIVELLRDFLRQVILLTPGDLVACIYLSINAIAPAYEGLELGIGESILMKAVADATGRTLPAVKASYEEMGDLGLVAKASRSLQRTVFSPPRLTVQSVFKVLKEIAHEKGHASMQKKKDKITQLLVACRDAEAIYLVRSLEGKLRIGLAEQSVLVALAHAVTYTPTYDGAPVADASRGVASDAWTARLQAAADTLKAVFSELPNYERVIPALLAHGSTALPTHCFLTPGIPVKPMLAQPTKGITEVLDRFSGMSFTSEFKYDGERAQIHRLPDGTIRIYSRNLEDNTGKYPDLLQRLASALAPGTSSFILDCEAVAWDRAAGKILPFQVLATRGRKAVELEEIKVQVCLYAFDLLFLNGASLVRRPLKSRREQLHSAFREVLGEFAFATHRDCADTEELQAFLNESIAAGCEGLMVKTLLEGATGASYEPSRRSFKWLKVKKDYLEGLADSFDLVPIGAYYGRGKRTGVYGAYLLACWDEEQEVYQSCCKIGTGFSDEALTAHHAALQSHALPQARPYYQVGEGAPAPDVWLDAAKVWEVQAADLSLSPAYRAAHSLVAAGKGISLRFPRFIRVREDKKPEDATGPAQIAHMYSRQVTAAGNGGAGAEEEDY
jgi:DNA ligase-1